MKFQFKGLISLLVAISFLIMVLSGVILYFPPRGGTSWITWIMFGLGRGAWEAMHVNICLFFAIFGITHLILNWSIFWDYVKKSFGFGWRMKAELLIAIILTGIIVAGTVYRLPPFSMIKSYGDRRGPPEGRGPGFGRGGGQDEGGRGRDMGQDARQGMGQGRQFRGGRGGEDREN
jgi:hypothetical protein